MRRLLITVLTFACACNVWAQKLQPEKFLSENGPVNIASNETKKTFIPPEGGDQFLKSGLVLQSDFQVEFVNFPENAKAAFLYAISIYESTISSPVPIKVQAKWESVGRNVLAFSNPYCFYKNFDGARLKDVYYPVALVDKLSGADTNPSEPDIVCTFNSNAEWFFGTNGDTPGSKYDFVSVAMHEIIHGLGFSGFLTVENGKGSFNNSAHLPSIYDVYVFNTSNLQLADKNQFTSPSVKLKNELESNGLLLKGADGSDKEKIYAPSNWNNGTSVYHYPESAFQDGDADALMTPFVCKGEAIHYPGEKTLELLAEFGWKSVTIDGNEIKDFEKPVEKLPVFVKVSSELDLDSTSVLITYSTDYFTNSKSVSLQYNSENRRFEGEILLDNKKGKVQYYYGAKTTNDISFTYPDRAPDKILSFKIGPDYYPPVLKHNPEKLITTEDPVLDIMATATDNVGIETVKVEYKINGVSQEPVVLKNKTLDIYSNKLEFPAALSDNDVLEYRILAVDNTVRKNKKYLPSSGFYSVDIFAPLKPVTGYFSNFDTYNNDFEISDFEITTPSGFSNGNLHTMHPYPESDIESEKYNLIAQLKYPVIIEENGLMSFDEVVLVEPGEEGTIYTEDLFWDFVIVEGSKNNGKSWLPVTDGYDSGIDEMWKSKFTGSLQSNVSYANGHENMFWENTINLTENTAFEAGDTVLFRFRLASDKSVTGWGWAIDNLQIQNMTTSNEIIAEEEVAIYPNPFSSSIFIEGFDCDTESDVEITITDLFGKTVFRDTRNDVGYARKFKVDLPNLAPGVYLANITDNHTNILNQRIIKN
ncbi:MAG: T9SS type A sorting domain-containing protein [Bacteroidota bacterium]